MYCKIFTFAKCRIWGEQGQAALEKSNICLLNCGPTGSETLKNLVLGGIGSITVVDGSKVEVGDLGNNFLGTLFSCVLVLFLFGFSSLLVFNMSLYLL
jgi:tRNA A37 threonylcarbamoyladenosine dehydratase